MVTVDYEENMSCLPKKDKFKVNSQSLLSCNNIQCFKKQKLIITRQLSLLKQKLCPSNKA